MLQSMALSLAAATVRAHQQQNPQLKVPCRHVGVTTHEAHIARRQQCKMANLATSATITLT
jgi:hypothetical protein